MKTKPSSSVVQLNLPRNMDASMQLLACMIVSRDVKNFLPLFR